ncbi:MAG: hypothetical protein WCP81_00850 [Actinomycetes bacterium]
MSRTTSHRRVIAAVGLGAAVVLGQTAALTTQASASSGKVHASSKHHKADKHHHAKKPKKHHHETETEDGDDNKVSAPAPAPSTPPAPPVTPPAPPSAPAALVNGTFKGKTVTFNTRGGNNTVTVTVTLANSVVTNATATWATTDGTSNRIITSAVPTLNKEVIKANSASVAAVSGATLVSVAYSTSLQNALTVSHR